MKKFQNDLKKPNHSIVFSATHEFINQFDVYLRTRGHSQFTRHSYLSSAKHFFYWLKSGHQGKCKISRKIVQQFLSEHLPACHCPEPVYKDVKTVRAALNQILSMNGYDRIGTVNGSTFPDIDAEIDGFDKYLQKICGHSAATRWYHRRHVVKFLAWLFRDQPILVDRITSEIICRFVTEQAVCLRASSIGVLVYSLRAYLKYLQFNGHTTLSLRAKIPRPPIWSGANLPKALNSRELAQFLEAFDRTTAIGMRDYAMARCLLDLGLRCHEVANIHLNDIDWHNGVLHLTKTKSRQGETLPITGDIDQALVEYLRYGRPKTQSQSVFVYHRAPVGKPVQNTTVRGAIRRAFARAGLPWTGTHILRSTVASRLLEAGVSLKEIADVLRHRSIDTTKSYMKVNFSNLAQVALPWPGRLT
jgi:site-specific recombinase XerD